MTAKTDIFEGLHVLLVTEDDARAQALSKALRDRKANVGDVKAGGRDPVALRGADLLLVDARTEQSTRARVADMRADVRARWASVATINFADLVLDDGAIYLSPLEEALKPLVAEDRALTERARRDGQFHTSLAPLGPSRMLRALALAGSTLHVKLEHGTLRATVDLSNELLVSAVVERDGERFEAWTALARILGLPDATVHVEKRAHPPAMNIMEPMDQALEVAAQERQSAAGVLAAEEQRLAQAAAPRAEAARTFSPVRTAEAPAAQAAQGGGKRTMLGMAPGPVAAPPAAAKPPAQDSRYSMRQDAPERAAPAKKTMLGMAPGALAGGPAAPHEPVSPAALKGPTAPANDVAPAARPKSRPDLAAIAAEPVPARPKSRPDLPAVPPARPKSRPELDPVAPAAAQGRLPQTTMSDEVNTLPPKAGPAVTKANPAATEALLDALNDDDLLPAVKSAPELGGMKGKFQLPPRQNHAAKQEAAARQAPARPKSRPELQPVELPPEQPPAAKAVPEKATVEIEISPRAAFGEEVTAETQVVQDAELMPADALGRTMPSTAFAEAKKQLDAQHGARAVDASFESNETTAVTDSAKLDELRDLAGDAGAGNGAKAIDSRKLMDAIVEEVPVEAGTEGATELVEAQKRRATQEETLIITRRQQRRSRVVMLFLLFLVVVGEYYAVRWFDAKTADLDAQRAKVASGPRASAKKPSASPAQPAAANAATTNAQPTPAAAAAPAQAQPPASPAPAPAQAASPASAAAQPPSATPSPTASASEKPSAPPEAAKPAAQPTNQAAPATAPSAPASAQPSGEPSAGGDVDALVRDGTRALADGKAGQAKDIFARAIAMDDKNAHAQSGLADALLALGQPAEAFPYIETAIKLRPKRAHYRVQLGDALKALGNAAESRAAYEKALEIDPNDREAKKRLAAP